SRRKRLHRLLLLGLGVLLFDPVRDRVLEAPDRAAEGPPHLREPLRAEDEEHDEDEDQKLPEAEPPHGRQPNPKAVGTRETATIKGLAGCPSARILRPVEEKRGHTDLALLELKNLHVALAEDGTEIVKGVDLAVSPNEVHAVM